MYMCVFMLHEHVNLQRICVMLLLLVVVVVVVLYVRTNVCNICLSDGGVQHLLEREWCICTYIYMHLYIGV